jgi:hypothetical protein
MDAPMRFDADTTLAELLDARLSCEANGFRQAASIEISNGVSMQRLAELLALASRHVRTGVALAPDSDELHRLSAGVDGWNPSQWGLLEALRIALLLSSPDMDGDGFFADFEHCFQFADHGESCAMYRALPLLPLGERFVWRAGEGCRSNMRTVFEAVACDSPYAARHFNDVAWRQLVIKAVFIDVPLSRIDGFDRRLSPELARMALDLADERRSAGRKVWPQLWLCLGPNASERGLQALQKELSGGDEQGRRAALNVLNKQGDWLSAPLETHGPFIEPVREDGFS